MIDPRALQQHFKNVNQRQLPPENIVPRVSFSKTLTSIEPIPFNIEPAQTEIALSSEILETSTIETFTSITSTIDIEQQKIEDDYNPYEYYSGPKF